MKAILLFTTDFNHSHYSKDLIGVFTNKRKFESTVKKIIKDDLKNNQGGDDDMSTAEHIKWNTEFFFEKNQTQGLSKFELVAEEVELNVRI